MGRLFKSVEDDPFNTGPLPGGVDHSDPLIKRPIVNTSRPPPGTPGRRDVDLLLPMGQATGTSPGLGFNRFGDLMKAGMRRESALVNAAEMAMLAGVDHADEGFDPYASPDYLRGFEAFPFAFVGVRSRAHGELVKQRIKAQQKDLELLTNSGGLGFLAMVGGAVLDPSILLSPLRVKTLIGMVTGEEAIRQMSQITRTGEEAFMTVGSTAILAGILRAVHTSNPGRIAGEPIAGTAEEVATGAADYLHPFNAFMKEVREGEEAAISSLQRERPIPGRTFVDEGEIVDPDKPGPPPRGLGAEAVDETPGPTPREELDAETMLPAWMLEKLPDSPLKRMLQSSELRVRQIAQDLADNPYFLQRHEKGIASSVSVETEVRKRWWPTVEQLTEVDRLYHVYRGGEGKPKFADRARRAYDDLRRGRDEALSPAEFRSEVGKAMHSGDVHAVPEVQQAAQSVRKLFQAFDQELRDADVYARPLLKEIERIDEQIAAKPAASTLRRLKATQKQLQDDVDRLRNEGPQPTNAESFFPVFYRHDLIMENYAGFKDKLRQHYRSKGARGDTLEKIVQDVTDKILRHKPFVPIDEDAIGIARSLRERTLDIPVKEMFDFIETDVDAILRYYTRTVSADLELTNRFGDITMREQLDEITDNFAARLRASEGQQAEVTKLMKERDDALRDIRAMRDRLRQTYGLPDDPYRNLSRFYRAAKQFQFITMLGGQTISSLPDLARIVMTEGFERAFSAAFIPLIKNFEGLKLSAREAKLAGTALEMELSIRAQSFSELGDTFGRHSKLERGLIGSSSVFSLVNLFNPWNAAMKGMAASVIASRIGEVTRKLAKGQEISKLDTQKLARANIDAEMGKRIGREFEEWAEDIDGLTIANTEKWKDLGAQDAFRSALSQDVERTIVTPGIGDRPLWMSTELGSVIGQFKAFSMSSAQRVLIPAIQQKDQQIIMGLVAMTGLGIAVDEIKRQQFGQGSKSRSISERLMAGIDRSGVTGYFNDINRIVEKMSDHQLGLNAMLGMAPPYNPSFRTKVGTVLGPTAGQMVRVSEVFTDIFSGQYDNHTAGALRRLLPGQNILWLKPAFDQIESAARF